MDYLKRTIPEVDFAAGPNYVWPNDDYPGLQFGSAIVNRPELNIGGELQENCTEELV
jgi:hypothetical protein